MAPVRPRARQIAFLALLACGGALSAAPAQAQPVAVKDAWVRAPAPGQRIAAAYLELVSRTNAALTAVASPVAARGELHGTSLDGGVMRMRPVGRIELPAGKTVNLAPGGLHIMLIDVRGPLTPGAKIPLALTVQRADSSRVVFTVHAEVRAAGAGHGHHQH